MRLKLERGWQGAMRWVILQLMPADIIAQEYHPSLGRPTKELYSMCGLMLIMEMKDWTQDEAAGRYAMDMAVHYALNLGTGCAELSVRSIQRYKKYFVDDELAAGVMADVTAALVEILGIKVGRQRLDSTHVLSNMARFGRTRLMGTAIKRFLAQVHRHNREQYDALPEELRRRYAKSDGHLFGDVAKDTKSHRLLREHVGNAVIQNTSDPDATREGPKGPGHKAQIAETSHPDNETQVITTVIPQTGADDDCNAMPLVLKELEKQGLTPEVLLADTHYGSDADEQRCAEKGVRLVAPAHTPPHVRDIHAANLADFEIDEETNTVIRCPQGHEPISSEHNSDTGKTKTVMPAAACDTCALRGECPVKHTKKGTYHLFHTPAERRLQIRRRQQDTGEFRSEYAMRAGIESTNSGLKRRLGFGRLRVRGSPAVAHAVRLKACGWNIFRAAGTQPMRKHIARIIAERVLAPLFGPILPHLRAIRLVLRPHERLRRFVNVFTVPCRLRAA